MNRPATPLPSAASAGPARPAPGSGASRSYLAGATLLLAAVALVAGLATAGTQFDPAQADQLRRVLETTTALAAVAVFALCRAMWRQGGEAVALWVGMATLLMGVAAATRPELLTPLLAGRGPRPPALEAVSQAAALEAVVLFAAGLAVTPVRERVRPLPLLGAAAGVLAVLVPLLRAAPRLQTALSIDQLTSAHGGGHVLAGAAVLAAWVAVAAGYILRELRERWRYTWGGLLLFALALGRVALGASRSGNAWSVGGPGLEALGMAWAAVACHLQLDRLQDDQRARLLDSELEAETAEVRERLRAANVRTRRHDLVNAITAIDGAATILEREFDRLSPSDRETLASVLGSGTERLRQLLAQEGLQQRVSLADTAKMIADEPAWHDRLELDVNPALLAAGSPDETAEAVRQLVEYACARTTSGPVTVRSERDGEWVVLRVEDRGPTMTREQRRTAGTTGGHGLEVAARLMREQGGDLWVEARPGGGSSFGICLPAASVEKGTGG